MPKYNLDNGKELDILEQKITPHSGKHLKLCVVIFLFGLILLHLYTLTTQALTGNIPTEIILSIALVLVAYLWAQELRDRHRLYALNTTLITLQRQSKLAEFDTITTLIITEEAKDPYTKGHSKMVAQNAVAIARQMGLSEKQISVIERAAKLHDIGKLFIPDEILNKPGKLTPEEWLIITRHPEHGIQILQPLRFLSEEKEIIIGHHERYDGKGYPYGLKGKEVPFAARILAVADTFDAMNSKRAYRQALPREVIIAELKKVSGSQLDPLIVKVLLNLLEENPHFWERE